MQVIINREELVEPLAKRILTQAYKKTPIQYTELDIYLNKIHKRLAKTRLLDINFIEVNNLINRALESYTDQVIIDYKKHYRPLVNWLASKFPSLDVDHSQLLHSQLLEWYADSHHNGFLKNIARHIAPDAEYIVKDDFTQPVIIRNIINNEESIRSRILADQEFWFTDAGYTNFIAAKGKPWHRLCRNHIHQNLTHLNFPADRLKLLESMPQPWRTTGNKILVVESSDYHHQMLGADRNTWRDHVTNELAKHTDRPVEYRAKNMDRKTRDSVYDLLMSSNEYYCVISDSSAAAIEAVWAGVPIITLNKHVTTAIARTQVSDINNLYRGPIGDWLCALTYSQFNKKEMQNGTAWRIIEKYHV
jgi:hypothetical protein